jgi:predicted Rossmann fold nucleotide-binding protein DprA/Smf involved in DNA uptake
VSLNAVRRFYGVDIVAHQFAMEYKLQTIGSCPFNQIYPKPHKNMAKMEENGGFMTEFGVPPILTRRTLYAEIEL